MSLCSCQFRQSWGQFLLVLTPMMGHASMAAMAQDLDALKQKQADLKAELDAERKRLLEIQRKKKRILENQIRRAAHRLTTKERKRRTRRLILLGSYLDHCMETDQTSKARTMKGLDEFLDRDQDRELFGLALRPKDA